jgi:shikimate dehydrogenase
VKRFGLIGFPLSHSFSKKFFTEKFEKEGLKDHVYDLFPIETIDRLPDVIQKHPDLSGLNVTIPFKQAVMKYITDFQLPPNVEACNCIRIIDGKLEGHNTDVTGFEDSFHPMLKPWHKNALILGNGGATVAVKAVLTKLGIRYQVVTRKVKSGTITYDQVDREVIENHKVIINTTPVGTYPEVDACPAIPYQYLGDEHYLFDLVYNPEKTLFLKKGEEKGSAIKNGAEMLVIQAEESWRIWNQ